jgi:hypothetical protein
MSNYLIFKGKETKSVNSVENTYSNYEITQEYTNSKEITATVLNTSGTLDLGTPESLPLTIPFIVLISDQPINLAYQTTGGAAITALVSIYYLAGNIKGYNFSLANTGTEDANITFRMYW